MVPTFKTVSWRCCHLQQDIAHWNRNVSSARLKQSGVLVLVARVVTGGWFHSCGPATAKVRRPKRSVGTSGMQRSPTVAECSRWRCTSSLTGTQSFYWSAGAAGVQVTSEAHNALHLLQDWTSEFAVWDEPHIQDWLQLLQMVPNSHYTASRSIYGVTQVKSGHNKYVNEFFHGKVGILIIFVKWFFGILYISTQKNHI